ncbi:hypothetical protein CEUSTIGMA_g2429.t1 [Chlamydomonas eustigma]|uniref:Calcineurin-like phosphoesterase domain-containing protein n=1 Tax=Chlamydomonas eustigma TaxID=1157962 RepID=A0A250WVV9_9CHLO|nr:hypothetical protein CEUSTIGMA_g2429.t1 [Chlamydomonas eustigma]|eukprot:GAX74983.1 hypothetical protein CEUSTIGMA_g2429.t1 [Chlamydomonas eustigma]
MNVHAAPMYSFGIIGDPQYADKDNGNVEGRVQRHREVPGKLKQAVDSMLNHAAEPLSMVLLLGDFIDGRFDEAGSQEDLSLLAGILEGLNPIPTFHVIGNHDLAFTTREHWFKTVKAPLKSYYSRSFAPGWRLVVLDTTDMSPHSGYPPGSPEAQEAAEYLKNHPQTDQDPQMTDWNGGVGQKQMSWLKSELAAAAAAGEKVITAGHHPIGEGSSRRTHTAWNWRELQDVLTSKQYTVKLHLSGHDHMGGYSFVNGVHFVTMEAMLEAPPGSNAYAVACILPDSIEIKGVGSAKSHFLPFK